jgi:ATP diphosphatase
MTYIDDPHSVEKLAAIMKILRDPQLGCPWDSRQTFESLASYAVEEVYEVCDAIARKDMTGLKEELGDLLLQIVFHAQIASEQNYFDFQDVVISICAKMRRRHPHVFAVSGSEDTAVGYASSWEEIKRQERHDNNAEDDSIMAGITAALPPLQRAIKLQKRAAMVHFDWESMKGVRAKLYEEMGELWNASDLGENSDRIGEELGDVFFTLVNLARHLKVDCEQSLYQANTKFESRFRRMEKLAQQQGEELSNLSPDDWERLWKAVK